MTSQFSQQIELTREEEEFLVETETEENKKPCFDARALRQMALTEPEVNLLQVFFMKARSADFNVCRFTESECLRALVYSLKYLPKTGESGRITIESYRASDNVYAGQGYSGQWSEAFRYEYGHARIWGNKERREPILLIVLSKVFEWVEMFQKAHGIYQELPEWLRDGMEGDFTSDSWMGSDLYEGGWKSECATKLAHGISVDRPQTPIVPANHLSDRQATLFGESKSAGDIRPSHEEQPPRATDKQKALLQRLLTERDMSVAAFDCDHLTRREASMHIDLLCQQRARHAPRGNAV